MPLNDSDAKERVLKTAHDANVRFIRLQFTDILGITKNVAIPREKLEKALSGELMFDGSSLEGFVRTEELDMRLVPDPATFVLFPWRPHEDATARLICDVHNPDGTPFAGCPRSALKRVLVEAEQLGYTFNVGAEPEFFLFLRDEEGKPTTRTHDQAGYFDLAPSDRGEDCRREIVLTLTEMGFNIDASHHEVAPGQHEVDFRYAEGLTAADNVATFRFVVRTIALKHNLHATFMPKPIFGVNGSGLHLHMSLFRGEENAFFDPSTPNGLSRLALSFIAGLLRHARAFTAVTNPLINSYKRLVPGYEAPIYVAWSDRSRSPLVRIPARRGIGTRVELRSPDASGNPYLALAALLKAGLDGVRNHLVPPDPVSRNVHRMAASERSDLGIFSLPVNLGEALGELARDKLIQEALGDYIFRHFLNAKEIEWEVYRTQVHAWEIEQYLPNF